MNADKPTVDWEGAFRDLLAGCERSEETDECIEKARNFLLTHRALQQGQPLPSLAAPFPELLRRVRQGMGSHGTHAEDAINAFEELRAQLAGHQPPTITINAEGKSGENPDLEGLNGHSTSAPEMQQGQPVPSLAAQGASQETMRPALEQIARRVDELETENHAPVPFEEVRALQVLAQRAMNDFAASLPPTPASGDTPRTDARLPKVAYTANDTECELGEFDAVAIMIDDWREMFELARQLERELAESDNDRLRAIGLYDSCKAELAAARSATTPSDRLRAALRDIGTHSSVLLEVFGDYLSTAQAEQVLDRTRNASTDESSKT